MSETNPQASQIVLRDAGGYFGGAGTSAETAFEQLGIQTVPFSGFRTTRVAIFGDSIVDTGFVKVNANTTNGFVVSSTVGTFKTNGSDITYAYPGNWVKLYNVFNPTLTDYVNNSMVEVISAPDFFTFTFSTGDPATGMGMADGNYSNSYGGPWTMTPLTVKSDQGFFNQLNYVLGGQFSIVANYSFSGQGTVVAFEYIVKALQSGPSFDVAVISLGESDIVFASNITDAITDAQSVAYANLEVLLALFQQKQIPVLLVLPPGIAIPATRAQQGNIGLLALRNALINLRQSRSPMVKLIDTMTPIFDGTDNNGAFIPNACTDGYHPSSFGSMTIAQAEASNVRKWIPNPVDRQVVTVLDDPTTYSAPGVIYANRVRNGAMSGTTGTVSTPGTGTVPDFWETTSPTGGSTLACTAQVPRVADSNNPNSAKWGYGVNCNFTYTGAGQNFSLVSPDFSGQMQPGNWYQWGITVSPLADTVNLQSLVANFQLLNGVNLAGITINQASPGTNLYPLFSGKPIQLVSDPFYYSAGLPALVNAFLAITPTAAGSGNANLQFSNAWVRIVDTPYGVNPV